MGAGIVKVTTSTDNVGSSANGSEQPDSPATEKYTRSATAKPDAHRDAHLEVMEDEASDLAAQAHVRGKCGFHRVSCS